jgi:hypothetical protein
MDLIEVEIFASGKHPDSKHPEVDYTPEWVRERAALYNAQKGRHVAPHTKGHPTAPGAPSYGWTEELFTRDEVDGSGRVVTKLIAKVRDFHAPFWDAIKAGLWRERSPGFKNGLLDHVAWLGAELPAVKGLAPVQFAEFEEISGETYLQDSVKNTAATNNTTGSFAAMDPEEMKASFKAILDALTEIATAVKAKAPEASATEEPNLELSAVKQPDESDAVKQLRASYDAQFAAQASEIKAQAARADEAEFTAFLDSEPMKRRLTTATRAEALTTMKALAPQKDLIEFSAGKPKITLLENYKNTLKMLPVLRDASLEGEFASAQVADEDAADANDPNARGLGIAKVYAAKTNGAA